MREVEVNRHQCFPLCMRDVCAIINQAFRFHTLKGRRFVLLFSLFSHLSRLQTFLHLIPSFKDSDIQRSFKIRVIWNVDMCVPQANYNGSSRLVFWFQLWSRAGYVDCSRMNVFNIINMSRSYTVFHVWEVFLWFCL